MRHLPKSHAETFVCFTDQPRIPGIDCRPLPMDLPGWWSKIGLLSLGQPLIYFDLDIVITGSLEPLLAWEGFGIIKNPWLKGFNSSVMKLTGQERPLLDQWIPGAMATMRGDQDWLFAAWPEAPVFPVEWFPSWKVHRLFMLDGPPPGAISVICHGFPKPHEIAGGWLTDHWTGKVAA